jgi:hypothetical protein
MFSGANGSLTRTASPLCSRSRERLFLALSSPASRLILRTSVLDNGELGRDWLDASLLASSTTGLQGLPGAVALR